MKTFLILWLLIPFVIPGHWASCLSACAKFCDENFGPDQVDACVEGCRRGCLRE